jgi:hypothetical protein
MFQMQNASQCQYKHIFYILHGCVSRSDWQWPDILQVLLTRCVSPPALIYTGQF